MQAKHQEIADTKKTMDSIKGKLGAFFNKKMKQVNKLLEMRRKFDDSKQRSKTEAIKREATNLTNLSNLPALPLEPA